MNPSYSIETTLAIRVIGLIHPEAPEVHPSAHMIHPKEKECKVYIDFFVSVKGLDKNNANQYRLRWQRAPASFSY